MTIETQLISKRVPQIIPPDEIHIGVGVHAIYPSNRHGARITMNGPTNQFPNAKSVTEMAITIIKDQRNDFRRILLNASYTADELNAWWIINNPVHANTKSVNNAFIKADLDEFDGKGQDLYTINQKILKRITK